MIEPQGLLSIDQRHGENFQLTDLWKKFPPNLSRIRAIILFTTAIQIQGGLVSFGVGKSLQEEVKKKCIKETSEDEFI